MTGLKLTFLGGSGWDISLDETVSGFAATVQCALVNLAVERGASRMHPDAGTDLMAQGVGGLLLDLGTTKHASNFAAAETKEFVNLHTTDEVIIRSLLLQPSLFEPPRLELNAVFVSSSQEEIGTTITP